MNKRILLFSLSLCVSLCTKSVLGSIGNLVDDAFGAVSGAFNSAANVVRGKRVHYVNLQDGHIEDGDTLVIHESNGDDITIRNIEVEAPQVVTVEKTVTTYTK